MAGFANGWLSERDIRAGATMRLFCLPHAGSGTAAFYRWKRQLPAGIDVCPVLLPGREVRMLEPSIKDAERLVSQLNESVAPYLDVPYAIFGHSMGALLAYEWALRQEPVCLFVSGREAAHLPFGHRELHRLNDEAFVAELRRRYGGMPEEFLADAELREVFLPILRADLTLVETYRHGADRSLKCPVMAFAGEDDRSVSEAGLLGWGELTTGSFVARRFAGDHFYHSGSGQTALLEAISERLTRVGPPPP
jgi:medium-chain acyl-[acyl-carrier-protein] hydrolase